jgi:broad specificity phosphatase PhoE
VRGVFQVPFYRKYHMTDPTTDHQHTVYLIRHAQPMNLGDATLRYDMPPGPPLSADGRAQAAMAASFLAGNPLTVVYTSPLDRAMQTAQIIAAQLGVPLAIDERLAEHRHEETADQVTARVAEFWHERVTTAPPGPQRVALVSHGSPIKLMLTPLGDVWTADPERYKFDYGNIVPHAGIWRARCEAVGSDHTCRWELALIFRTFAASTAHVKH